jgi:hypothetical protein
MEELHPEPLTLAVSETVYLFAPRVVLFLVGRGAVSFDIKLCHD